MWILHFTICVTLVIACQACFLRCAKCKGSLKNAKLFNGSTYKKEPCFSAMDYKGKPFYKTCEDGKSSMPCVYYYLITIPVDNIDKSNNYMDIRGHMELSRNCKSPYFKLNDNAASKSNKFNRIVIHVQTCGTSYCNGLPVEDLLKKYISILLPFCKTCKGFSTTADKCATLSRSSTHVPSKAHPNNMCYGVCYVVYIIRKNKKDMIIRGCMPKSYSHSIKDNKYFTQYRAVNTYPGYTISKYCNPSYITYCNTFSTTSRLKGFNFKSTGHLCVYCDSGSLYKNDKCKQGTDNSIFAKAYCNGKCYSIVIENRLIRGCKDIINKYTGNNPALEREISTDYYPDKGDSCFTHTFSDRIILKSTVCQQECSGKGQNAYCNTIPMTKLMQLKSQDPKYVMYNDEELPSEGNDNIFKFSDTSQVEKSSNMMQNFGLVTLGIVYFTFMVLFYSYRKYGNFVFKYENDELLKSAISINGEKSEFT